MVFTVVSGVALTAGLFVVARYASQKWASFALAFLAVQCLLNAVYDLINLFYISSFTSMHTDAANMASATGLPAIVWAVLWIGISLLMISIGLRIYAVNKKSSTNDTVFED